jgi:hypothetical protein
MMASLIPARAREREDGEDRSACASSLGLRVGDEDSSWILVSARGYPEHDRVVTSKSG